MMVACVERACALREVLKDKTDCPVDHGVLANICEQMQKQTLLEISLFETLSNQSSFAGDASWEQHGTWGDMIVADNETQGVFRYTGLESPLDSDVVVSIMACYTYPPFIRPEELQRIIEINL